MIPHLLNKPQELTRAFCVLLKNCLTDPNLRDRIINDGAVAPLVKLLHKTEIKDASRSDAVVAAAAAAVWNLTAHPSAKASVIREKAVEALEDRVSGEWCAVAMASGEWCAVAMAFGGEAGAASNHDPISGRRSGLELRPLVTS